MLQKKSFYNRHTSSCMCVGFGLLVSSMRLALTGRRQRRSNLFQADLSLTRGSLRLFKFVPDEFDTVSPRDSACRPHPFGASPGAVQNALRFVLQLELFRVYINI
jgi:hypothetical protein